MRDSVVYNILREYISISKKLLSAIIVYGHSGRDEGIFEPIIWPDLLRKIMSQWPWLAAGSTSTDSWAETSKTADRKNWYIAIVTVFERRSSWGKDLIAALF